MFRHDVTAESVNRRGAQIIATFANGLPAIRRLLVSDIAAAFADDPAAGSVDEVVLCYPGISALSHHRFAHRHYRLDAPLVARIITELAHSATGIDIYQVRQSVTAALSTTAPAWSSAKPR